MEYTVIRMMILFLYVVTLGYVCNKYKLYKNDERGQAIIAKASSTSIFVLNLCVVIIFILLFIIPMDNKLFSTIIALFALIVNLSNSISIMYLEKKM